MILAFEDSDQPGKDSGWSEASKNLSFVLRPWTNHPHTFRHDYLKLGSKSYKPKNKPSEPSKDW